MATGPTIDPATGFAWPRPPFDIVLVEPQIPGNTGNIARLCAATGSPLHLVGPLGFRLTSAALKRAGLDYWDAVALHRHRTFEDYAGPRPDATLHLFSTKGEIDYTRAEYRPGDALVFGSETSGLSDELRRAYPRRVVRIPMMQDHVRSLNLANCVAIALYEALRQTTRT